MAAMTPIATIIANPKDLALLVLIYCISLNSRSTVLECAFLGLILVDFARRTGGNAPTTSESLGFGHMPNSPGGLGIIDGSMIEPAPDNPISLPLPLSTAFIALPFLAFIGFHCQGCMTRLWATKTRGGLCAPNPVHFPALGPDALAPSVQAVRDSILTPILATPYHTNMNVAVSSGNYP